MARGNVYRVSFYIGDLYYLGMFVYLTFRDGLSVQVDLALLLYIGVMLQAIVFHIYCLLTCSALPLSKNPLLPVSGFTIMSLCGWIQVYHVSERSAFSASDSTVWFWIIYGAAFSALAIMHLISLLWKERQ